MEALEWFSAAELADHKLPQLPGSVRAIQLRAKREDWSCRDRTGRGGGFEYPLSTLPENIQASLLLKQQTLRKQEKPNKTTNKTNSKELWTYFEKRSQKMKEKGEIVYAGDGAKAGRETLLSHKYYSNASWLEGWQCNISGGFNKATKPLLSKRLVERRRRICCIDNVIPFLNFI